MFSFTVTYSSMANLIYSAKSGSAWAKNELNTYNMHIQHEDAATFFGIDELSNPPWPRI
jgi:hypothetical protein